MSDLIASSSAILELPAESVCQYLSFRLGQHTRALLSVSALSEVFELSPQQVIPIPDMPPWVLGIFNQRGEILWVIDLAGLLNLPGWDHLGTPTSYPTLSIRVGSVYLGMAVSQVDDMEWCDPSRIESLPGDTQVGHKLSSVLQGYLMLEGSEDIFMVLNGDAILNFAFQAAAELNPAHSA